MLVDAVIGADNKNRVNATIACLIRLVALSGHADNPVGVPNGKTIEQKAGGVVDKKPFDCALVDVAVS